MSEIRPGLPALPTPTAGQAAPIRAAQAAFFRAALTDAQTTPTQAQTTAPATTSSSDGTRLSRPGRLLDIRV